MMDTPNLDYWLILAVALVTLFLVLLIRFERREHKKWKQRSVELMRQMEEERALREALERTCMKQRQRLNANNMEMEEKERQIRSHKTTASQLQEVFECFKGLVAGFSGVVERGCSQDGKLRLLTWKELLETGIIGPMSYWLKNAPESPLFTGKQ